MQHNPIAGAVNQARQRRLDERESLRSRYLAILETVRNEGQAALDEDEVATIEQVMEIGRFTFDDIDYHVELLNRYEQQKAVVDHLKEQESRVDDAEAMRQEVQQIDDETARLRNRRQRLKASIKRSADTSRNRKRAADQLATRDQQLKDALHPIFSG
jgi:phenylalanyl-tRNA synthetase alpha subunit